MYDPLLLRPGALIETTGIIIGVETGSGKETVLTPNEIFMYLDVQPSKRGWDYFRFKIMAAEFVYVDATIDEFKKWFGLIYLPVW